MRIVSFISRIMYTVVLVYLVIALTSCREDIVEPEVDPEEEVEVIVDRSSLRDWSTETHSDSTYPNYSVVFNQNEVLRLDIVFSEDNWDDMQDDLSDNLSSSSGPGGRPGGGMTSNSDYDPIWVPCSIFFEDTEWYQVGIRYKGNSSLSSAYQSGIDKLSFKVDFDEFESDYPEIKNQRFYGFKQLNIKNNYNDQSLMREKVASDLFFDFGVPSPQTSFCEVYVDYGKGSTYFGLYTIVEEIDDSMLESQFFSESGNLYKPDGDAAMFASGTYDESEMEKKNNEDASDYSDVLSLYNSINSSDRTSAVDEWKTELTSIFDVDLFLKWLAANTVMQNWDTYGNMTHNYYLYNDPSTGLITWIPWDNNEALQNGKQSGSLSLSLSEVESYWPLIRYIINIPEYEELYQNYVNEFNSDFFTSTRMNNIYSQYYSLLKESAYAESSPYTFIYSSSNFDNAVDYLKEHVEERNNKVATYLGL